MYKKEERWVICNKDRTIFYGYFTDGNLVDAKFWKIRRLAEECLNHDLNKEIFTQIIKVNIQVYDIG